MSGPVVEAPSSAAPSRAAAVAAKKKSIFPDGVDISRYSFSLDDIGNPYIPGSDLFGSADTKVNVNWTPSGKIVLDRYGLIMALTGCSRNSAPTLWNRFSAEAKEEMLKDLDETERTAVWMERRGNHTQRSKATGTISLRHGLLTMCMQPEIRRSTIVRREMVDKLGRYIAGDTSLIEEIMANAMSDDARCQIMREAIPEAQGTGEVGGKRTLTKEEFMELAQECGLLQPVSRKMRLYDERMEEKRKEADIKRQMDLIAAKKEAEEKILLLQTKTKEDLLAKEAKMKADLLAKETQAKDLERVKDLENHEALHACKMKNKAAEADFDLIRQERKLESEIKYKKELLAIEKELAVTRASVSVSIVNNQAASSSPVIEQAIPVPASDGWVGPVTVSHISKRFGILDGIPLKNQNSIISSVGKEIKNHPYDLNVKQTKVKDCSGRYDVYEYDVSDVAVIKEALAKARLKFLGSLKPRGQPDISNFMPRGA